MEAVGKHTFDATNPDEVSFQPGDVIKVLNMDDPDWFKAEIGGAEGFIPSNYIEFEIPPWFRGKIKRAAAQDELMKQGDGSFLVRESESSPGDFSLSVKHGNRVQHFKILKDEPGKYFLWVVKFNSINELIKYHKQASVSRTETILLSAAPSGTGGGAGGNEKLAKAQFDFAAREDSELGFSKGDLIYIDDDSDPNWWAGRLASKAGEPSRFFPSAYTAPV